MLNLVRWCEVRTTQSNRLTRARNCLASILREGEARLLFFVKLLFIPGWSILAFLRQLSHRVSQEERLIPCDWGFTRKWRMIVIHFFGY
jgi:hypothetical protein